MSECENINVVDHCACGVIVEIHDTRASNVAEVLDEWRLLHECEALKSAIDKLNDHANE